MPDLHSGADKIASLSNSLLTLVEIFENRKIYDPFATAKTGLFANPATNKQTSLKDINKIKKGVAGLKRLGIQYKNDLYFGLCFIAHRYFMKLAKDAALINVLMKEEKREK